MWLVIKENFQGVQDRMVAKGGQEAEAAVLWPTILLSDQVISWQNIQFREETQGAESHGRETTCLV